LYTAGRGLSSSSDNEVVLGQGLAENLGAKVGDTVVLLANTPRGGINAVEAVMTGSFSSITKAYDDVVVRLPLTLAHRLLRVQGSTRWVVLLKDTDETQEAVRSLKANLPPNEFSVTAWSELADFYNKTAALFSKQVGMLKLIIFLVVVLAISNSMTIAIVERTTEIGTAFALGATSKVVMRRFLVEGCMLGAIGTAIGLIVGIAAARLISRVGIPMPPPPGMGRGFVAEILLTPGLVLEAALIVMVCSLLAAVVPAWRASKLTIVDAIRTGR
jgi:putative ABC transport system permease protein